VGRCLGRSAFVHNLNSFESFFPCIDLPDDLSMPAPWRFLTTLAQSLPESQVLPRVLFFTESKITNSQQRRLCREQIKKLPVKKKTLKNSRHRKNFRHRNLCRVFFSALGKEILKKSFLPPIFFYPQLHLY
jgi:hypothetical protein